MGGWGRQRATRTGAGTVAAGTRRGETEAEKSEEGRRGAREDSGASADVGGGEAEMVGKNEPGLKEGREKMKNQGGKRQKTGGRLQRETARELWLGRGKLADRQTDGTGGCGVRETGTWGHELSDDLPLLSGMGAGKMPGPQEEKWLRGPLVPEGGGFAVLFSSVERAGGWGIRHCDFLSQEVGLVGSEATSCPKSLAGQRQAPTPQLSPSQLPSNFSNSVGLQALPPLDPTPQPLLPYLDPRAPRPFLHQGTPNRRLLGHSSLMDPGSRPPAPPHTRLPVLGLPALAGL